jgi:hypothetical protein
VSVDTVRRKGPIGIEPFDVVLKHSTALLTSYRRSSTTAVCDTCRRPPSVIRHATTDGKARFCLVTFNTGTLEVGAVTCCATSSCLPERARLVTVGFEASGTTYPPYGRLTRVTGKGSTLPAAARCGGQASSACAT